MAKSRKLINKMQRRQRLIREATKDAVRADKAPETMEDSPAVRKLMLAPQRRYDAKFGYDTVGQEPYIEVRAFAAMLQRVDFDPGAGTDFGIRLDLDPDTAGEAEETEITTVADTGEAEMFTLTAPATAGAAQADYFTFEAPNGDIYAVWLDIDAAGTAPTGAAYLASDEQVEVDIVTGDTAAQVATKIVTELGLIADLTITDNLDGTVQFSYDIFGERTDADTHNADDSLAGSFLITLDNDGVDSNLNSSYFLLDTPDNTDYYVWFNVDSQGTDPMVPARTGVEVAISASDSANDVAAALAAELDPLSNMSAVALLNVVTVTNDADGASPDAEDGAAPTGFGFVVSNQGVDESTVVQRLRVKEGDTVQILSGDLEGMMLEVVEVLSGYQLRLDDVSTFTSDTDAPLRMLLSSVKKSWT